MSLKRAATEIDEVIQRTDKSELHSSNLDDYFETIDDRLLVEQVQGAMNEYTSMIRDMVLKEDRIDILAEEVLGYSLEEHHSQILASQQEPIDGKQITLAFRGAGKSTVGTIARTIFEILKNPDIRILITSNTQIQAEIFLREIKNHFGANDKLKAIFGDWVGPKWDAREIIVKQRTKQHKESTVTCIGVGGPTASRHYDLIIADDLVDEENSRTELQRERLQIWYYKSLTPTLVASGRLLILGTRWHPRDLYGTVMKNTVGVRTLIIPAIKQDGSSAWPDEWPIDKLLKIKAEVGIPIFETQYQMNADSMEGKIFSYDSFHWYDTLPQNIVKFQGGDLAISMKDTSDYFAFCTVAYDLDSKRVYVVEIHRDRKKFKEQTDYMARMILKHESLKCGVEANAYQAAQVNELAAIVGKNKVVPVYTLKDKKTRAMKLEAKCSNEQILFHKSQMLLIEELLAMPDGENDDMFDALEIAVEIAIKGARKRREEEPGLL